MPHVDPPDRRPGKHPRAPRLLPSAPGPQSLFFPHRPTALLASPPPPPAPNPSSPPPAPPPYQAPVVLTSLGVAGWQVSAGAHSILVDPYFSRVDVEDTSAPLFPDQAAITRYAPEH